jgi:SAM-dependent methyltransferase
MAEREEDYWWHLGRLRIIETYLRKVTGCRSDIRMLNVGCGTGGTIPVLEKYGEVNNLDVSEYAISFMLRRGYSRVSGTDGVSIPYTDNSFDVVCAFDVLEHIEDDVRALAEWSRVLKADGAIILTVPAYQCLWSGHDVALHHYRRYTKKRLICAATAAGLRADKASYAIVFSLPLLAIIRVVRKITKVHAAPESSYVDLPKCLNWMFTRFLYFEAKLHRHVALPAGSSVAAILRRN